MHEFVAGLVFVAMAIAPCVAALTVKMHDARRSPRLAGGAIVHASLPERQDRRSAPE
jgi:hypothetical protein